MARKPIRAHVVHYLPKRSVPPEGLPREQLPLGDTRFRTLLSPEDWALLPATVRQRFSKRLTGAASAVYQGEVLKCTLSRAGWCLAQLLRLIGGPLPLSEDSMTPAIVCVTEDVSGRGQFWTRQYGRRDKPPQTIRSTKSFAGPTGLEEHIGGGIGVALTLLVEEQALMFKSDHFFWKRGSIRLRLPSRAIGLTLAVGHIDCGDGWFAFTLDVSHVLLGQLIHQTAMFRDTQLDPYPLRIP